MVKKFGIGGKTSVEADVIVLGCTLPGIVAAHKLKSKFGDSMDIVVLDLGSNFNYQSKCNVGFTENNETDSDNENNNKTMYYSYTARQLLDNVARIYLLRYAKEFKLPLPDSIINPENTKRSETDEESLTFATEQEESVPLQKLFQYPNGTTVEFLNNLHDFEYLSFLEKFELNQYQTFLDHCMTELFQTHKVNLEEERKVLLYYDRTTMEKNICETLLFSTSREIMRIIVRLVCGAPAKRVSLLFYLHQCYRTSSTKNHLGGLNTRFREKLLGHCRKRLSSKLQQSIADITMQTKSIKQIRTYSEQVILETLKGEITYTCNLLAMALRPDQLHNIHVEDHLMTENHTKITKGMQPGYAKKFNIQYRQNFWSRQGYSGDIFSMRGPIIWAMERPRMSTTGSLEKYSGLIGYLMVRENDDGCESKAAVVQQLVNLFGEEAADPVSYRETLIADVYVPSCGDYISLRRLMTEGSPKFLEWGALDVFAEGDVAAALEAGHTAYLHLLGCLRPQALTYDDFVATDWPTFLSEIPLSRWKSQINVISGIKITMCTVAVVIGVKVLRSLITK
ncbi:hypothetical protein HW555_003402 [Spodoptera exigua]|uniref:Amine oxidase domain-containing protein n=1 Tax=Spodoptera exigua TaxID=7107 RepID=A0A835GNP0_SPOEX|nr:hypothetical protein HW555_003402 [Spodoptera exigua]